jgi:hypothetical protein
MKAVHFMKECTSSILYTDFLQTLHFGAEGIPMVGCFVLGALDVAVGASEGAYALEIELTLTAFVTDSTVAFSAATAAAALAAEVVVWGLNLST